MSTAGDRVKRALRICGVIASGETPSYADMQDGLETLNLMLDSLSTEGLSIPQYSREVFKLTGGKSEYTVGGGGDFDTDRFMEIVQAKASDLIIEEVVTEIPPEIPGDPPTFETTYIYHSKLEMPVRIMNIQQYADVQIKDMQSTYVTDIYPVGSYPLEKVIVWPVPNQETALVLYSHKPIGRFENASDVLNLPQGYEEMIDYNLAKRMSIEYGRQLPAEALDLAAKSLGNIKRKNTQPLFLKSDALNLVGSGGMFNIYKGDY